MLDAMTPAVERALAAAKKLAGSYGSTSVEPRHLLLALFDEPEGRAYLVARECGLDAAAWIARHPPNASATNVENFSEAATSVLRSARRRAREFFADRTVSSEFLLLAIADSDAQLAAELRDLGFRFDQLEATLLGPLTQPLALAEPNEPARPMATPRRETRVLDANSDRACEALRVLEDVARFVFDDHALTQMLKELRHDLAAVLSTLEERQLIAARDTPGDVGTSIATDREYARHSIDEVLAANFRRLQESLRSLEEFGKLQNAEFAQRIESLRYRVYAIQPALTFGGDARERLADARLCFLVSADQCPRPIEKTVASAIAGGVKIVQLREKHLPDRVVLATAKSLRRICHESGAIFIVNDRPDLAAMSSADGVHLGQDDLPLAEGRRLLGPDALIGLSTHTPEQLRQAIAGGASYVGIGPTFQSRTKPFDHLAGLEFIRQAAAMTSLPAFALGGIASENVRQVVGAGATRIAVSSAIASADDPESAARELLKAMSKP